MKKLHILITGLLLLLLMLVPNTALAQYFDWTYTVETTAQNDSASDISCEDALHDSWERLFAYLRLLLGEYCGSAADGEVDTEITDSTDATPSLPLKPLMTVKPTIPEKDSAQLSPADERITEVLELVNAERAAEGLPALVLDDELCRAAAIRAEEICESFSHTRPDGSSCFTVLADIGYTYRVAGENLAIGQSSAAQAVRDWMDSPGHRDNIMGSSYGRCGIAITEAGSPYGGYAWVQLFSN